LVVLWQWWGRLVGILDGNGLAFLVELIESLGVLIGLVLIGRRGRRSLNRRRLLGILLVGLLRSGLGASG
jgi:hypothetical protein